MTGSVSRAAGGPQAAAQRMEAAWPAVAANVGEARALARDFGHRHGASPSVLDDIALAVSEAASNVVLHAFVDRPPGTLSLIAEAGPGELRISVIDDGSGMHPRADSPGLGLGLPTIGQLTRSVDLRGGPGGKGSEVRMVFAAEGVRGPAARTEVADPRYDLLIEVDRVAEGSAWPAGALERLVDLLVPAVADACAVDVIEPDGNPRRTAARIAGSDAEEFNAWLVNLRPRVRQSGSATEAALREHVTRIAELTPEHIRAITASDHDAAMMTATGVRWWVVVPMHEGARNLGLLHFGTRTERPSTQTIAFMEAVAERAAGALARNHLIDELQRTRRRLERVLGVLDEAIVVNDPDGTIVYANTAARVLLAGSHRHRLRAWTDAALAERFVITGPEDRPLAVGDLPGLRVFADAAGEPLLTRWTERTSGRERRLRMRAARLEEGGPLAVNVIQDVTDVEAPGRAGIEVLDDAFLESAGLLAALYASAPVGMAFMDHELRYRRVSTRLTELSGLPAEAYLGRTARAVLGDVIADQVEPHLRSVLESGAGVRDCPVNGARPGGGEGEFHWIVSFEPVFVDGRVIGVSAAVSDLTARIQLQRASDAALRRAEFLSEATRILDSSLDFQTTLQNLARSVVPEIADWCSIQLVGEDGTIRQVAVAHSDPLKEQLAWELNERYPSDPQETMGAAQVIRSGEIEVINDISDELLRSAATDDYLLGILRDLGLRASLTAPLTAAGRTLGAIALVAAETKQRFDDDDVALAQELARRAAVSVENARLFTAQHQVAETLQRALLPERLPDIAGLTVAARYRAATEGTEVGGDFYDLFPIDDERWMAVIGDVVGKGAPAAAMTAMIRYTLRGAVAWCATPELMLEHLNARMRAQYPGQEFCTTALVGLRRAPRGWRLEVCLGGHAPPLVIRAGGALEPVGRPGTLIGAFADVDLETVSADLGPGDTLLLYTDGLTRGEAIVLGTGQDRQLDAILDRAPADPVGLLAHLEWAAAELAGGHPRDDVALIALRANDDEA